MNETLKTAWYYCQHKVAPLGSDWYYALLKMPDCQRQACVALLTLEYDWQSLRHIDREPAELKLAWWQQQLANRHTDHPALQLLAPVADSFGLQHTLLQAMLDTAAAPLYRFDHFQDVQRAAYSEVTAPLVIGLYVLSQQQLGIATPLHQLIFSWQLWSLLRHWQQPRSTLFFAEADMQSYQLASGDATHWPMLERQRLFNHYHQHAAELYTAATQELRSFTTLKPLLRYAKLQASVAKRHQAAGFPATPASLTPVKKLWLTWFL